ncbi:hypothetical protein [Variovorax sp.]|jgi:hypothetical protein|uniref:hypothetical protein n=1 Tax=Variovorax sp. TaxID=1871043 RepID=UPI0037D9E8C9
MISFVTLGPIGSNHQYVLQRFLNSQGLAAGVVVEYVDDFAEGAARVIDGRADFMLQCAVHPATHATVARFKDGLYVVDTFISSSQDLAVLRDRAVDEAHSLALMAPTLGYVEPGRWGEIVLMPTVAAVAEGMRAGRIERGLTYASLARELPGRFEVEAFVGSVDDAWIIYGRERISGGGIVAWPAGPVTTLYRRRLEAWGRA